METLPSVHKTGWWANLSPNTKTAIYVGGTIVTLGLLYLAFRPKAPDVDDSTTNTATATATDETKIAHTEQTVVAPQATATTELPKTPVAIDLPNGGVGCGAVHTDYDMDYNYVKCNGIWFTKSKANPLKTAAKDKYTAWVSLETNKIATEKLNVRYTA